MMHADSSLYNVLLELILTFQSDCQTTLIYIHVCWILTLANTATLGISEHTNDMTRLLNHHMTIIVHDFRPAIALQHPTLGRGRCACFLMRTRLQRLRSSDKR